MSEYNGHKDWNHWNVSLWINNDEGFYRWARELVEDMGSDRAAREIVEAMEGEKTPDGADYDYSSVKAALREILE